MTDRTTTRWPGALPIDRRGALGCLGGALSALAAPGPLRAETAPAPIRLSIGTIVRPLAPAPARPTTLLAIGGAMPAEPVRVRRGAPITIEVTNGLDRPTGIHLYGLRGKAEADGVIGLSGEPIAPGETRRIVQSSPDAGAFWLHAMAPGETARQVERGLSGLFVIEEASPPVVDHERPLVIDDIRLAPDGSVADDASGRLDAAMGGRLGNLLLANGAPAPVAETLGGPGHRIRLRIVNASNARLYPLRFEGFARAAVVAIDGHPCTPFDPLRRTVVAAPGSRFDVIADLPALPGEEAVVAAQLGDMRLPLAAFRTGEAAPARHDPAAALEPNPLPDRIRLQTAWRTELAIAGGLPREAVEAAADEAALARAAAERFPGGEPVFRLNHGFPSGFAGKPLFSVKRGTPVVVAIRNSTDWPQVIHLHGHVFRLLHAFDDGWEPYFLDTLYLPPGQLSRIAFDADNPGRWAIRSSILEHFEAGVATWYEVKG